MNCERWQLLIEEYVDRELDAQDSRQVEEHVSGCPSCQHKLQEMNREIAFYAKYQHGLEMPSSLWAGVQARIRKEPARTAGYIERFMGGLRPAFRAPRFSFAHTIALMVVAVGITAAVIVYRESRSRGVQREMTQNTGNASRFNDSANSESGSTKSGPARTDMKQPLPAIVQSPPEKTLAETSPQSRRDLVALNRSQHRTKPDASVLVRRAERLYLEAIAVLSKDIERRDSKLDPALRDHFEEAIAAIDRNIAETRRAVRENPQDPVAAQYLLTAYARKVDVLKELAGL